MKKDSPSFLTKPFFLLASGWVLLIALAYGRVLIHPELHFACPENDTWNFPVRFSVLDALNKGHIPLWNPLSAFGVPWLASWATEVFYPGTLLFTWLGLTAWNYSGVLHLLIFSLGVYFFLRNSGVKPFGAFLIASIALLNGCAFNHLGSNSPTDTMAWIPWVFMGTQETLESKPWGRVKLGTALALQLFAGYPQIVFYTLIGVFAYAAFCFHSFKRMIIPIILALLVTICQWLPALEYFLFQAVRLPAVKDNPGFTLPLQNLMTFIDFNALAQKGLPDYVASPTYFYFNFYSGLIPLAIFIGSAFRFKQWNPLSRFWVISLLISAFWTFGFFSYGFNLFGVHLPNSLEPAKAWVLVNFFELVALGCLWENLFPRTRWWHALVLIFAVGNLLVPIWQHPLERNLLPPNAQMESNAQTIKNNLGSGRLLVLADEKESAQLYTPLPDPELTPHFKYFVPNSNLLASLPLANFYSSTWPTWGAMDASFYFKNGFPYSRGRLLDLLGVDLLLLNENKMPNNFKKVGKLDNWILWKNKESVGKSFVFKGQPQIGDRKEAFNAFAAGSATPLKNLYLEQEPISSKPNHPLFQTNLENHYEIPANTAGFLVVTQNAMPGWRVWVNEKPRDLLMADGIFQCVSLDQGDQTVDLGYEPASFRLGLFISLLTLACLVGGFFFKA